MKQIICGPIVKSAVGLMVALTMASLPAYVLVAPQIGHAQNVPPVTGREMVGFNCWYCNGYVGTRDGKMPAICPLCKHSLAQPAKPKPAPQTKPKPTPQTKPKPAPQTKPKLQAINPFGDFLFHDVPIIPDDGKLKTRHLDPNGLAVKAEEWGKEMKQVDDQSRQKQEAQAQEFERNKQDLLKSLGTGPAHQQLKNIFAGGENGWDNPADGKTGVRIPDNATVKLLRDPESTGEPVEPKKLSELTDQELTQRSAENQKEIKTIMGAAKLDIKNDAYEQKMRLGQQGEMEQAQEDMQATAMDAFTYVGFTAGGDLLDKSQNHPGQKRLDNFDTGYTLYTDGTDSYKAAKETNLVGTIAAVGDYTLGVVPDLLVDHNLVGKEFVDKAAGGYAIGKGVIGLSAGGYSYYNLWNQNEQLDLLGNQRLENIRMREEKLKKLEENQKQIKAEQDQRAERNTQ